MSNLPKPRMGSGNTRVQVTLNKNAAILGAGLLVLSAAVFGLTGGGSDESSSPAPEPTPQPTVTQVVVSEKPVPGPTVTQVSTAPAPMPVVACAEYLQLADDTRAAVIEYEHSLGKMSKAYNEGIKALAGKDWSGINKVLTEMNKLSGDNSESALKIAELDDDMRAAREKCDAARK